jgi:hypothetical protein
MSHGSTNIKNAYPPWLKGASMVIDCPYTQFVKFGIVVLASPHWMNGAAMVEVFGKLGTR